MRGPCASRNRAAVAVELSQRFGQAVRVSSELHGGSVRQVFALAPQKRHAWYEHAEGKEPEREFDGHVCEKDGEQQEITNGAGNRFLLRSSIKDIVDVVGVESCAARENRGHSSRFLFTAFTVFFPEQSITNDSPQRASRSSAERSVNDSDEKAASFENAGDAESDAQVAIANRRD